MTNEQQCQRTQERLTALEAHSFQVASDLGDIKTTIGGLT